MSISQMSLLGELPCGVFLLLMAQRQLKQTTYKWAAELELLEDGFIQYFFVFAKIEKS